MHVHANILLFLQPLYLFEVSSIPSLRGVDEKRVFDELCRERGRKNFKKRESAYAHVEWETENYKERFDEVNS